MQPPLTSVDNTAGSISNIGFGSASVGSINLLRRHSKLRCELRERKEGRKTSQSRPSFYDCSPIRHASLTPFQMEDSPLSITANVTGIFTSIAAVLAFIYVRYATLSKGQMEIITVRSSVEANLEDLRMISVQSRLRIKESDDNDTIWLKKLIGSIYAVELVTGIYVKRAAGVETSLMSIPLMDVPFVGVTPTTWTDAIQGAKEAGIEKESLDERIASMLRLRPHSRMAFALLIILRLGTTPRLVRWYRVRERVLEKIRQREDLRSRLLSHQVSMANS